MTVRLASSDQTEGVVGTGSLAFTSLNWSVPQTVTVSGIDDQSVDGDIDYAVTATASSIDPNYNQPAARQVLLSNRDNDSAVLTVSTPNEEVFEGSGAPNASVTIEVTLSGQVENGFRLPYVLVDGTASTASSDFFAGPGFVDFLGNDGETVVITVEINSDVTLETDETFSIRFGDLQNVSTSAAQRITVPEEPLSFTILDDDETAISLSDVELDEGTGTGTTTFFFNVELSNPVQGGIQIHYTTNDGTATLADGDYVDNDGILEFAGTVVETKSIRVEVVRDATVERDEQFTVSIDEIVFLDPDLADTVSAAGGTRSGRIVNDDTATIAFTGDSSLALEPAGNHRVDVRLTVTNDGTLSEDVTLDVVELPGGTALTPEDYTLQTTSITFPAGSRSGETRPIEMSVVSDDPAEEDETVFLGLALLGDGIDGQVSLGVAAEHRVRVSEDPMTASISGRVWMDRNGNGNQEAGEVPIPGVFVMLSGIDLRQQAIECFLMTGSDGAYRFDELPAGTYAIRQTQPSALGDGGERLGSVGGVPSGTVADDRFSGIVLAPGEQGVGYDFAERNILHVPVSRRFFLASTPPVEKVIREVVAQGEERSGDTPKAAAIRRGEAVAVRRSGSRVEVTGTSQADVLQFFPAGSSLSPDSSRHRIVANGMVWTFDPSEVGDFSVRGGTGDDEIELYDSPRNEFLEAVRDTVILRSDDFRLEGTAVELARAFSMSGGEDTATQQSVDFVLQLEGNWIS